MAQMVIDSSALILLAKCNLLEIVCDLFEVIAPETVTVEVASEKLIRNYPDAALISDLISKEAINVKSPGSAGFTMPISLHQGEQDALLLSIKLKRALLATDDGKAIRAARFLKIPLSSPLKLSLSCLDCKKYHSRRLAILSKSSARLEDIHLRSSQTHWSH